MLRRIIRFGPAAAALLTGLALAPTASAGNTAWSVSLGIPGFAVSAGRTGYGGGTDYIGVGIGFGGAGYGYGGAGYGYGAAGYGHGYRTAYQPYYRPYYRPYYAVPVAPVVVYPAPVAYAAPYGYVAPVPYGGRVYAPHRAYVAAPAWRPPVAMPYGRY